MFKWWNKIDQALQLNKSISFDGSYQTLRNKLKEEKQGFNIIWESNYTFKFHAYLSVGTFSAFAPICGYGEVYSSKGSGEIVQIKLYTKTRFEVYCFFFTALIFLTASLFSEGIASIYLLLFFAFFLYIPWQGYRIQERELFRRFESFLGSAS